MKSLPVPPHEMSYPPDNVTALSQALPAERPHFRHLSRVARVSLYTLVIAALGGPSCLVTSSPDFQKPERTPPFLTNLLPPPYQVIPLRSLPGLPVVYPGQSITFEIVSEDLQSGQLQALLLLDFEGFTMPVQEPLWKKLDIPPGHFNNPGAGTREPVKADFSFPHGIALGCHSTTLAVSHQFKQDLGTNRIGPEVPGDIATVTWWYDLDGDPAHPVLTGCVFRAGTAADAGTDGEAGSP